MRVERGQYRRRIARVNRHRVHAVMNQPQIVVGKRRHSQDAQRIFR